MGSVSKISKDPLLSSSENRRIVMAGMVKEKMRGSSEKKLRRSALPAIKKPEKKNHPVVIRNMAITRYAMGERK